MSQNSKTEIWQHGVDELAQMIKRKEISCVESVNAHLERIEQINSKVNAITVVLHEEAIQSAKNADELLSSDNHAPPLLGVPMTVKENIDCVNSATTFGLPALKELQPTVNAPHIQHLKDAGAIVIGRTNTPDLGLRIHTDNELRGATLNPWNLSHTPGGSSGGDAAAVAAGMTPLGIGNDYGGSLRCPANFCGVTTIRPSFGRVPDHMSLMPTEPAITLQLFMVQGPIVRQVKDLRTPLQIMSQNDPRDPRWLPVPFMGEGLSQPVKVAKVMSPGGLALEPAVEDGINKAAEALIDAGYEVEETEPPKLKELWQLWIELTGCEIREFTIPAARDMVSKGGLSFLTQWIDTFPDCGYHGYVMGLATRNQIAREWSFFQAQYPLILGPVFHTQAFKVDADIESKESFFSILEGFRLNMSANVLGLPSVAVPVGISNDLPQGVQLIGPRFHEDLCLDAAQAVEDRLGIFTPVGV